MFISRECRSPHFEPKQISVQFAVLHYTAQSLKKSLEIFLSPFASPVSCHLLIDERGGVFELVESWEGPCQKAFHAGPSRFVDSENKVWEDFNNFSLGIELVNWNGNIFYFTESQYESLFKALSHLKSVYPALQNPDRIVGHEHIAGFRGKKDPGHLFDWPRLFKSVYLESMGVKRSSVLTKKQSQSLFFLRASKKWKDQKAKKISLLMEKAFPPFWLKRIFFYLLMR